MDRERHERGGIWSSKRTMMAITALTAAALFGFVIASDPFVHNRKLLYAFLIVTLAVVLVAVFGIETRQRRLEQITAEQLKLAF